MRRIIDLSIAISNDVPADPAFQRPRIQYSTHHQTAETVASLFPGLAADDLPDGQGWAVEQLTLSSHNGTHVDAPWHYHATMDGGRRAIAIDEVPLDWCLQPGVKLDFRRLPDGYVVQPPDIDAELERIGHTLQPLEIVLVNTAAGACFGQEDYIHRGCGVGRAGTLHLTRQGVRVVGTDAWSWDAPFSHTARRYAETRDAGLIWEGHKAGRDACYCQIEKLHGLEQLPATGFLISCLPVKIQGGSGGWTRAVAILED